MKIFSFFLLFLLSEALVRADKMNQILHILV